jgi:hypothetical protein
MICVFLPILRVRPASAGSGGVAVFVFLFQGIVNFAEPPVSRKPKKSDKKSVAVRPSPSSANI